MERFLERMSLSQHKDSFILKGGVLVTAMVGLDMRMTMDESEYEGVRLTLAAFQDTMCIPLKIDISTGDQITPAEISFQYKLMFEERYISVWAYNLETVLAEKLEAILVRSTSMRELWRVYQMKNSYADGITWEAAASAARFLRDSCISNLKEEEGDLV